MAKYLSIIFLAGLVLLFVGCSASDAPPPDGVLLPYPEQGQQYRMSEICQHLQNDGYDVRGTITHVVYADDLSALLDNLPSLVRTPVENYLDNGVSLEFEITGLCNTLNK